MLERLNVLGLISSNVNAAAMKAINSEFAIRERPPARTHYGIVVTNSRYTSSAEQLAATNQILLLHYRDLINLDDLLHKPVESLPKIPAKR